MLAATGGDGLAEARSERRKVKSCSTSDSMPALDETGEGGSSNGLEELDSYQVDLASFLLPFDPSLDGRHPGGNQGR